MRYSEDNIEDWDFRHCSIGDPAYNAEADAFFSENFTTAVGVDALRLGVIKAMLDAGFVELDDDEEHVRFTVEHGDALLAGWKSGQSRLTRDGRFERKVVEALRRENRKYGRLRITILPPLPGLVGE